MSRNPPKIKPLAKPLRVRPVVIAEKRDEKVEEKLRELRKFHRVKSRW